MQKLKIAFVVDRFGNRYGGAEAYGVALMSELAKDHDITVFARDYDPDCGLLLDYVPIKFWRRWPSWFRVLLTALRVRRLTRHGYDIVHSHSNGWSGDVEVMHVVPTRYNWRVRPLPVLKRLTSYFSLRVQTYLRLEAKRVQPRKAHHVVAVSSLIAQQLEAAYGARLSTTIIPPGVYLPDEDLAGQRNSMREALGFSDADKVCILVARNPLRKGLKTALTALKETPAHYKLLVVGSDPLTDRRVHTMPEFKDVTERVSLIHATSDVTPYYRAADICIHPTLNDSFGMAPLEAMTFGLPVVISASPWCGFAAYLQDGENALILTDPTDAWHLTSAMQRLGTEADLRYRLQAGAEEIVKEHAWPVIAHKYLALYRDILVQRQIQSRTQ